MPVDRKPVFDAAKVLGAKFTTNADVALMDKAIDNMLAGPQPVPRPAPAAPVAIVAGSRFVLGEASMKKLGPVKPQLRATIELAITFTLVDFKVLQSLRTVAEQVEAVRTGHSRTMKSKHLKQADGSVWAVDLGAWVNGKVDWNEKFYAAIAFAMDKAATQLGYADHIRWGASWDRVLSDFGGSAPAYLAEAEAYAKRHAGSDLIDMPHFEWVP